MQADEILERLIAFPTVVRQSNLEMVDWVCRYLTDLGAEVNRLMGPEGDRENILASFGPCDVPGILFSGHMDVVPATEPEWQTDPFVMHRDGEKLFGRGTSDMKGYIACVLAAMPKFAEADLKRPVLMAFSYDEECGCQGAPHMIKEMPDLCAPPIGCVIGEPTGLRPVLAHKGKTVVRIDVKGRSGHSSRTDLGKNAIHALVSVAERAVQQAKALENDALDERFTPAYSTLQLGTIQGGSAVNIIPDHCCAELEARAIAGVEPQSLLTPVRERAEQLQAEGFDVDWDVLATYPPLSGDENADIVKIITELSGREPVKAVSFGAEAGLFEQAGMPSVICGPGEIERAHRPNEYVTLSELSECQAMIEGVLPLCCQER